MILFTYILRLTTVPRSKVKFTKEDLMKIFFLSTFIICFFSTLKAQKHLPRDLSMSGKVDKSVIDSVAYDRWTSVNGAVISNDGKYAYYQVKSKDKYYCSSILKECEGDWELKLSGDVDIQFTTDSRMAMFTLNDTLNIIKLGEGYWDRIPNVKYILIPTKSKSPWIGYKTESENEFVLRNIYSGRMIIYNSVKYFSFSEDGNSLLVQVDSSNSHIENQSLFKIDLISEKKNVIWMGTGLIKVLPNYSATKFVFLILSKTGDARTIWYKNESEKPVLLVNNRLDDADSLLVLDDLNDFSDDGRYASFTIRRTNCIIRKDSIPTTVTVWSYLDGKLQQDQLKEIGNAPSFLAVVDTRDYNTKRIEYENDRVLGRSIDGGVYLLQHLSGNGDETEWKWNSLAQLSYLIRFSDKKEEVKLDTKGRYIMNLSPRGKYVIYYDHNQKNYFSYEIESKVYRNITSDIRDVSWIDSYREDMSIAPRGIAGWLKNDDEVLIYDRFDIWLIDPSGRRKPFNVTNGYGLRHGIVFNVGLDYKKPFSGLDTLVLNAIDLNTKENGFFKKDINRKGDPIKLTMGDYIYQLVSNPYVDNCGYYPIKAVNGNCYIVSRMKSNESPNYFFTRDFKNFKPISDVYPERLYNWYTTELHSWKKDDGHSLQGVLYKPENFDPQKKYPVIFYYYEKKSFALNEYLTPHIISGNCNIDIPSFVSNGYLVFSPDIEYKIGDPMQGTYDAVISAARYLNTFPYIDGKRMGVGGCSFGGVQTNYLVTHTSLFAAAYSASSLSDFISAYGDVPAGYKSLHSLFESGQARMGATLWEIPDQYIKNSAVLNADKVSTPLLLMHTTHDGICSFSQAVEFFTALRRLGKRSWLLEYTEGNHGIYGAAAIDFGIRLRQFFDHYLKGKPAAIWMTRGVPAANMGRENGYELDLKIPTPERRDR